MSLVEVILDGGELVEIEAGIDDLTMYVQRAKDAGEQIKAWQRQAAIAKGVIDKLQVPKSAVYDTDFGPQLVTRTDGGFTRTVDLKGLIASEELKKADLEWLLNRASLSSAAIDKDDSELSQLIKGAYIVRTAKKGWISITTGTKRAP